MVDRRRRARLEERKTIVKKSDISKSVVVDSNNYILNDEDSPVTRPLGEGELVLDDESRLVELAEADTSLAEERTAHLFDGGTVMNTLVTRPLGEGELVLDMRSSDILANQVSLGTRQLQQQVPLDNVNAPISQASSSLIRNTVISAEAYNGRRDLWQEMRIRVTEPLPYYNTGFYSLSLSCLDRARQLLHYVRDLTMQTMRTDEPIMTASNNEHGTIRVSPEAIQELMNQLWLLGFRPAESLRDSNTEIDALRSEITYLRSLVQSLTQANRASEQPSNST